MKRMFAVCLTTAVLQAAPLMLFAATPAASPLAGRWAIDVATLPMPAADPATDLAASHLPAPTGKPQAGETLLVIEV